MARRSLHSKEPQHSLQGEDPAYLWLPCWSGPPGLMARAVEALQRDDAPIAQPGTLPDLQVGSGFHSFECFRKRLWCCCASADSFVSLSGRVKGWSRQHSHTQCASQLLPQLESKAQAWKRKYRHASSSLPNAHAQARCDTGLKPRHDARAAGRCTCGCSG